MEYLKNGDFLEDLTGSDGVWNVTGNVERVADGGTGGGGFYVSMESGARIEQNIRREEVPLPNRYLFSMDLRVSGGTDQTLGNVQLVLLFQVASESPFIQTFTLTEFATWQTVRIPLNRPVPPTLIGLELLVLGAFTKRVSVRKFSLTDGSSGGTLFGAVEVKK